MSSYTYFADVYDSLTENVNYKVRSDYISDFFKSYNINSGLIVDLACGTGSFSKCFDEMGYDVLGVDLSAEMLMHAKNKLPNSNFILSKMEDFCLDEEADGVICCLDSINHLENKNDVQLAFKNVFKSLKSGGLFVFDVNTEYKHNFVLADNVFVFDEDDFYLVWENEKLKDNKTRILIDIFAFNGESYDRFSEEFIETAYSLEIIKNMLQNVGFKDIKMFDDLSTNLPNDKSERVYFVAKKE